jgi:hypothetical protein
MTRYINNHFREAQDVSKVEASTLQAIQRAKIKKYLVETVYKVLQKFDGKQITKRLVTTIQKELPDYTISLEDVATFKQLNIWRYTPCGSLSYDKKLIMFLGYNGPDMIEFNYEKFMKDHTSQHQYDGQIADYENALTRINVFVGEYNVALAALEAAHNRLNRLALTDWE